MNGEPSHQHRWNCGIARQTFGKLGGDSVESNARCRERVIARNRARLGERDKTSSNAPVNVLESKLSQVAVKRVDAAGKWATVMIAAERFGYKRSQRTSRIN